jgi:alpha-beta hydrolase superfamily lysophospholipase
MSGELRSIARPDGYALTYRVWESSKNARATAVLLNGIMSHSLWFAPLADPLAKAGIRIVGADRRGTGPNRSARGDAHSAKELIDDVRAIIEREKSEGLPLHLVGWCWGAVLAINVAAEIDLASLILLAPGLYSTAPLVSRMKEQESIATSSREDQPCLQSPITEEMFTRGPMLENFVNKDPDRLAAFTPRFHQIMAKLGMGAQLKLPKLKAPILMVLATRDEATDNPQTERHIARLTAGRAKVERIEAAHGIQLDAPEALAGVIRSWIEG